MCEASASPELSDVDSADYEDDPFSVESILRPISYKPSTVIPYGGLRGLGPVGALGEFAPDASINTADPSSDNLYGA